MSAEKTKALFQDYVKKMTAAGKAVKDLSQPKTPISAKNLPPADKKKIQALLASIAESEKMLLEAEAQVKSSVTTTVTKGKSMLAKLDAELADVIKKYKNAVKNADSLTTMRPATVKALDVAAKQMTPKAVSAAQDELDKHVKDVTKASAKSKDKAAAKAVKKFTSDIDSLKKQLAKL